LEYYPPVAARRKCRMLKKILLALVLVLQFAVAANVTVNHVPWPECFPCDNLPL